MSEFMPAPCQHCPFRTDVTPFLHPARAEEIAYATQNRYNSFWCHKTLEHDDEEGENYAGESSKVCAGFLTMMACSYGTTPYDREGFEPSNNCYCEPSEMVEAYEIEWEKKR